MKEVTIKHYGKIVKGVKHYYNPKLYSQNLLELEGKEFEEVLREKNAKLLPQLKLFLEAQQAQG